MRRLRLGPGPRPRPKKGAKEGGDRDQERKRGRGRGAEKHRRAMDNEWALGKGMNESEGREAMLACGVVSLLFPSCLSVCPSSCYSAVLASAFSLSLALAYFAYTSTFVEPSIALAYRANLTRHPFPLSQLCSPPCHSVSLLPKPESRSPTATGQAKNKNEKQATPKDDE